MCPLLFNNVQVSLLTESNNGEFFGISVLDPFDALQLRINHLKFGGRKFVNDKMSKVLVYQWPFDRVCENGGIFGGHVIRGKSFVVPLSN